MKKLLIASTALVATAGMANAEIAITGHAAAGYHSGLAAGSAAAPEEGIFSNAGVDFAYSGVTDNGISYSASVGHDAGTEIDQGDFEFDGADGAGLSFGAVAMTGTFGTITFDDAGIDNLYDDGLTAADVSYSTIVGPLSLTLAMDANDSDDGLSASAGYAASGMTFTLLASDTAAGTSASLAVAYALNESVSLGASTDQAAGEESVQTINGSTTLNGLSIAAESSNDSTWELSLGYALDQYTVGYTVDNADDWNLTATTTLGATSTLSAGVNSDDAMYAGVGFTF